MNLDQSDFRNHSGRDRTTTPNINNIYSNQKSPQNLLRAARWNSLEHHRLTIFPLPGNHSVSQFLILCILGAVSILICGFTIIGQLVDSTAWLCGWAITILVLGHEAMVNWHCLPLHLALSMLAGVYLIGVGGVYFGQWAKHKTHR